MSHDTYPKYIDYDYGGEYGQYSLKQTDENTWHVRSDGMHLGTVKRDEAGFYKPGSDRRHDDFDTAVRLTIRGVMQ